MPSPDSPAILVARFLQSNNYNETLSTLLAEAGLPLDAGVVQPGDITLEQVLEEKKIFDLSVNFEKVGVGDEDNGWTNPAPKTPSVINSGPSTANILHVSIEGLSKSTDQDPYSRVLLWTTADRRLNLASTERPYALVKTLNDGHDSPILSCAVIAERWLLSTSMSGQLVLSDLRSEKIVEQVQNHTKYVVKVAFCCEEGEDEETGSILVATAGWDQKVFLYRSKMVPEESGPVRRLGKPIASLSVPDNPESILIMKHPESGKPLIIMSTRDSTFLHYYGLPKESEETPSTSNSGAASSEALPSLVRLGRQNLAPHSNSWIAFSPSAFALSPSDPTLLAVATSSVPHMKLLLVRLLIPPPPLTSPTTATTGADPPATQAAQTREALRIADKEAAAILSYTNTLAPQTPYSTPQVCWRPDSSGVWVNGDDGVVRGIEARSGKVTQTLRDGHVPGSKIRCICAGVDASGREVVLSGGFDKRLVIWSVSEDASVS
ncbi:MAG: 60S ribosomal protein L29 [Chaenotheca gracillima]|nr:MAG: 60S ribosomal protein L29 [Chaenotheca gracillima]